jgi:hypothetical protein
VSIQDDYSVQASQYEFAETRTTWVAGRRYYPRASLEPGEAANLVRDPANPHDRNAIAVVTLAGERAGYLPQEVAAENAALLDRDIIRLAARLAEPGEPEFDAARVATNPALFLWTFIDRVRLDEFLARAEWPAGAG